MNPLRLNRMTLSPAIWAAIAPDGLRTYYPDPHEQELIDQADYKTGSISPTDAAELRAIVEYFEPRVIAEVGTYIGRSTRAMAVGTATEIYTCDASNAIELSEIYGARVEQFPKTTSTAMFETLLERKVKPDLFYIDGRLTEHDPGLMAVLNQDAVIVLDDFEGIEKGVSNATLLLSNTFSKHVLVYPRAGGKTAMLIAQSMLLITAQ